jgi:hypothetical protein
MLHFNMQNIKKTGFLQTSNQTSRTHKNENDALSKCVLNLNLGSQIFYAFQNFSKSFNLLVSGAKKNLFSRRFFNVLVNLRRNKVQLQYTCYIETNMHKKMSGKTQNNIYDKIYFRKNLKFSARPRRISRKYNK